MMPVLVAAGVVAATPCRTSRWPLWERYAAVFISHDGRVIDRTADGRSTSEGQAYGLFFALVADDRARFARLLRWTEDNLARGALARHLPAWHWGRGPDGRWGVLDSNSASDADLWLAYALLEAGRLWSEPRYERLARAVLSNVALHSVRPLPGLGVALLPAPYGFEVEPGRAWRLNPSYSPPFLLRRLSHVSPVWADVLASGMRVVAESSSEGFVADWVLYHRDRGFGPDPVHGPVSSYDAIRVYLWAGMLAPADPLRAKLDASTRGPLDRWTSRGQLSEKVDLSSADGAGHAPPGFFAALLPQAQQRGDARASSALKAQLARARRDGLYGAPPAYYDQNLALFGEGFVEGRYRFGPDGSLRPRWENACRGR